MDFAMNRLKALQVAAEVLEHQVPLHTPDAVRQELGRIRQELAVRARRRAHGRCEYCGLIPEDHAPQRPCRGELEDFATGP